MFISNQQKKDIFSNIDTLRLHMADYYTKNSLEIDDLRDEIKNISILVKGLPKINSKNNSPKTAKKSTSHYYWKDKAHDFEKKLYKANYLLSMIENGKEKLSEDDFKQISEYLGSVPKTQKRYP